MPRSRRKVVSSNLAATRGNAAANTWLTKALNPAHGSLGAFQIPDATSSPSVAAEFRDTHVLTPNGTTTVTTTWNLDILFMPSARGFGYWRWWPSESPPTSVTTNWQVLGISTTLPQAYMGRTTHAGLTVSLIANALSNQGTIHAGQVPLAYMDVGASSSLQGGQPPLDPDSLQDQDPKGFYSLAKEGAYLPLKFREPTSAIQYWGVNNLANRVLAFDGVGITPPGSSTPYQQPPYINTNLGVVLIRGIAATATVQCRSRYGVEATEALVPWVPFVMPSPQLDPSQLAACAMAMQLSPNAYPASANDMWSILRAIGRAVSGKIPRAVASVLSQAGIPVVSPLAGAYDLVMQAFT